MAGVTGIDWSIIAPALGRDYSGGVQQAFDAGQQWSDQQRLRAATAAYMKDPGNKNALAAIAARNPQLAFTLEDRASETAAQNALAGLYSPQPSSGQPAPASPALPPQPQPQPSGNALAPPQAMPAPPGAAMGSPPGAALPTPSPSATNAGALTRRPMGGPADPAQVDPARQEAWATLARNLKPEQFIALRKANLDQQKTIAETLVSHLQLGSQAVNATLQAPPEQRAAVWQQQRQMLGANGINEMPEQWDENTARSRLFLGVDTLKALGYQREAADTESLIQYRKDETAIGRDRNRIEETNNIRTNATSESNNVRSTGASVANNERSVNASMSNNRNRPAAVGVDPSGHTVLIYPDNRVVTTQGIRPVSAAARRGRQGGGAGGAAEGATATGPGGHKIVVHGGRWVDAQTGQPVG